jgi:carotenoid cleavage dioxygenase-like enzyme
MSVTFPTSMDFNEPPIAPIRIPMRLRSGVHGNWVLESLLNPRATT